MCGIAGFVDPAGRTPDPQRVLHAMRQALRHRGPDDAGDFIDAPAFLGHRRLSIVDLSPAGRQPFVLTDPAGAPDVVALANGELYNHYALRPALRAAFPDATPGASDCAILPWLWRLHGPRLLERLVGMYALAVWDARRHTLLLARDPGGEKPLYYAPLPGGGLAFASEPKALLAHPLVSRAVDPVGLRRYLTFDYVPGRATVYAAIRKLEPGAHLLWTPRGLTHGRHGEIPFGPPVLHDRREIADAVWRALGDAVEARLMADVPLGVFLSGGLDSTAVTAALTARRDPATVQTFSIGFDDASFDESAHARAVAAHLGTTHHEQRLSPETLLALVPELIAGLDEPFADASIVPTWLLSRFARQHVTVALGGDGGDELFQGYPTYAADAMARLAARLPRPVRRRLLEPLARLIPHRAAYMSLDFKARRFLSALELPADHRHPVWIGGVHPDEHAAALSPALAAGLRTAAPDDAVFADIDALVARFQSAQPSGSREDLISWLYLQTYLADDVLMKVDRASMAHALEVRAPLLDPALARLAGHIPSSCKRVGAVTKRPLRDALAGRVPPSILRRPKQGFGVPMAAWLRGPLSGWMRDVLDPVRVARGGLLDPAWTTRLMDEHLAGRVTHHKALWSALVLELWRAGTHGPDRTPP